MPRAAALSDSQIDSDHLHELEFCHTDNKTPHRFSVIIQTARQNNLVNLSDKQYCEVKHFYYEFKT